MSKNSDPIAEMISNDIVSGVLSNDVGSGGIVSVPTASIVAPNVTVGGQVNVGPVTLGTSAGTNLTFASPYEESDTLKDTGNEPNLLKRIYMFLTRSVNESNHIYTFVSNTITVHADRYWSVIRVNEQGQVYYKVFRGWFGGRWLYRCGILRGYSLYWESVPSREKLESTLGLTHLKVEEMISKDKKRRKNIEFVKEICKTDPDNLKIIAELDKLDKGINESYDEGASVAFAVSGAGTGSGP